VTSLQSLSLRMRSRTVSGPALSWLSPGLQGRGVRADVSKGPNVPRGSRVTGRLAFPVPSSTLPVAGRALEVFRSLRDARLGPVVVPSRLWLASRAPLSPGPARAGLLSWDSSGRPLARAPPIPPLQRHAFDASTPAQCRHRASDPSCHPRIPVPPSWFRTTSTVSSASNVAGLLHPAAIPGVRRVSVDATAARCRSSRGRSSPFPATLSYPSKNSPRPQPFHVTVAVAPSSFRSFRSRRPRGLPPRSSP